MHFKSLLIGFLLGALVASGCWWAFGDMVRGQVAGTAGEVGRTVQEAGKALEKQSEKLR